MDQQKDHQSPPDDLHRILILRPPPVFTIHEHYFSNKFHILKAYESPLPTHDFLRAYAQSVKVILCSGARQITADIIRELPALELVVSAATGVNHIDMAECRRRGVSVTNVADVFSDDVADAAVGLFIDVMRRITAGDGFVRRGSWPVSGEYSLGFKAYDARVIVKSKVHYFLLMNDRLDQPRRSMFKATCFGPWLDLTYVDNEEGLVHYMLRKQFHQNNDNYDLPLVYYLNGHSLYFGRNEFCLVTGFRFGMVSFRKWRSGDIPFRHRVFPNHVGQHVKSIDLLSVIEDEELFLNLSDEDAIRVCLLITLEVILMGKDLGSIIDDIFLRMVEDLDEWNAFPWGELLWRQLYESIRNVSSNHPAVYRQRIGDKESNDVPTYSLKGFVAAFKIWIIECADTSKSKKWWNKAPGVIPRALAWSKHTPFRKTDYFDQLFDKDSKPNVIMPTCFEAEAEWFTRSIDFFKWYTPRAPPLAKGGPWDEHFQKVAAIKARQKVVYPEGYDMESMGKEVEVVSVDERVKALEARTLKLETIIQVIMSDRDKMNQETYEKVYGNKVNTVDGVKMKNDAYENVYGDIVNTADGEQPVDLANEYCSQVNDFFKLFDTPHVDVDGEQRGASKKLSVEAEKHEEEEEQRGASKKLSVEAENRLKVIEKLNSTPFKRALEQCETKKRRVEHVPRSPYVEKRCKTSDVTSLEDMLKGRKYLPVHTPRMAEMLVQVKPWVEVLERPYQNLDKVYVNFEVDRFLVKDGWRNCVFPWSDIVVDRRFWDGLTGFDDNRKGWLRDEHIDVWISYMWHTRPSDMEWSMVSCFFLPLLMNGRMPVWYATKETYPLGWGDVQRVFIPINEPETHWSLAVYHIQTGRVTFYDSGPVYDPETRPFYLSVRKCLETRLPEVLQEAGVFEKKGIDPMTYRITFNNAMNVPKQGGLYDDCGVWLCIFLFRLGNGKLLDVDDPVQAALAYRERMVRFYYKHKTHVG